MIIEWLRSITTAAKPVFRQLGYLHELIAIEARYRRHRTAWQEHLQRTRQVIIEGADKCQQRRKAVVLGSGVLLDIPIDYLAQRFEQLVLVDAVHLGSVRRRLKKYKNVYLLERDINGIAEALLALDAQSASLPVPNTDHLSDLLDVDLLVSANILSQLPILPVVQVEKVAPQFSEQQISEWLRQITETHIHFLQMAKGVVCCITDILHHYIDRDNKLVESEERLYTTALSAPYVSWCWQLVPYGELSRHYRIEAEVVAYLWDGAMKNGMLKIIH